MKTIGLIGGMSWESSLVYYQLMNELVKEKLGGTHSAKCLLHSFDFFEIEKLQHENKWEELTHLMVEISKDLKHAGCDFIMIGTNTMHIMAPDIEKKVNIKVLHIADATGEVIREKGLNKVALLGTKFTMYGDFYKERLKKQYNIEVITPDESDGEVIHHIIYNELVQGNIKIESKDKYKHIIQKLVNQGAEGVILGCTEIPLLIKQEDCKVPVFDTTYIHAKKGIEYALDDN